MNTIAVNATSDAATTGPGSTPAPPPAEPWVVPAKTVVTAGAHTR